MENQHIDYFQVGSHIGNTGNDHIFNSIKTNQTIVLIEPVPFLFKSLKENYSKYEENNKITYLNIAVSNKDGTLELFIPSEKNDMTQFPDWVTQLSSVNESHIPMHNIQGLIIDKIAFPCFRLNTLVKNMNISSINTLYIDTEGHDYDILMDFDLSILKPKTIIFESTHMERPFLQGTKYTHLVEHFKQNGYTIVYENGTDTCVTLKN